MSFVKNKLIGLSGVFYCIFIGIFLIVTSPVYVFRVVVIYLAKFFRPDLGDILSGQSTIFVADYMADTTPRSNIVYALIFQGQLTIEDVRARVFKNWIFHSKKLSLENFQRYPEKWMGFVFWKDASKTFSLNKHVYSYSGKDTEINDEQLTEIIENFVNKRIPKFRSPWELILIENYKNPHTSRESASSEQQQHSVLIISYHHCLVDGFGLMTVLVKGLFEKSWEQPPKTPLPKTSFSKQLLTLLTFPLKAFSELSYFLSFTFRCEPFKVSEGKTEWYQQYSKSGPMQIKLIKRIKNAFGVSYTSVLLSAMCAAVYKTLGDFRTQKNESMLCLSVLPARDSKNRKVLANHMSAALLNLPISKYGSIERLKMVDSMLEDSRTSVVPILSENYSALVGAHTNVVNSFLTKNRMVSFGLTNFISVPENVDLGNGVKWIHSLLAAAGHGAGVAIAAVSHGGNTEIHICAERSILSREQVNQFLDYIKEEIESLYSLMPEVSLYK